MCWNRAAKPGDRELPAKDGREVAAFPSPAPTMPTPATARPATAYNLGVIDGVACSSWDAPASGRGRRRRTAGISAADTRNGGGAPPPRYRDWEHLHENCAAAFLHA
ncbi:hypothetical protein ACPA9J_31610 [Pseudomonas aeruginosa]